MKQFDTATWAKLTKIYPERAGVAYEYYLRDPKKNANIPTVKAVSTAIRATRARVKIGSSRLLGGSCI